MSTGYKRLHDHQELYDVIEMFLEYRNDYEYTEEAAKFAAVNEHTEGYDACVDMFLHPHHGDDSKPDYSMEPLGHKVQRELDESKAEIARLTGIIRRALKQVNDAPKSEVDVLKHAIYSGICAKLIEEILQESGISTD